jgi:hypothetical protein
MKKQLITILLIGLILLQPIQVLALTSSEAKQDWYDAKQASRDAQQEYRDVKIAWATNKSEENNQKVIDTGKNVLHRALDEAEAWLIWRNLEVEENPMIPEDLKQTIQDDVESNLAKIDELHVDVDEVENRLELGLVFLKMVGKYFELLTDVARNTGFVWVDIVSSYADTVEDYESKIRESAQSIENNEAILEKLDKALDDLQSARTNIDNALEEYDQVVIPGNPILKFSSGNQYLRIARNDLIAAQGSLREAYRLLVGAE